MIQPTRLSGGGPVGRTIALLAGYAPSLVLFRAPLVRALSSAGHRIIAMAPDDAAWRGRIEATGAEFFPVRFARAGIDPVGDMQATRAIENVLRRETVDTLLAYTIKPIVFGVPAAARAGVRHRIALVTGLGYTFGTDTWRQRVIGSGTRHLYRRALRTATSVRFQNPDDRELFVRERLVEPFKAGIVAGSGVDVEHYCRQPMVAGAAVRFLLIARLLADKGIREYVAAAREVLAHRPECEFHLVGPFDPNPMGLKEAEVQRWAKEGVVTVHPPTDDVRPHLAACHVYVLPSYREGIPRTVLEAMSTGRPIITTDAVGCRETTVDGDNGLLVPVKDASRLAQAMLRLAADPELRERMGRRSREIAEEKYDVRIVNQDMMRAMELVP